MMKHPNLLFIIIFIIYDIQQALSAQCPDVSIQNISKARSWYKEGIQIYNSSIRLLRGGQENGSAEQISNLVVWDSSTNHCLKEFDLEIQISKMFYSKIKRKLFVAGTHKIIEIHPLTFNVIDEHNIGGVTVSDVEYSESQLLISKDYGNPFIYDIFLKQIVESLPYQYLTFSGIQWSNISTLKDFTLLIVGKLIIFDKNDKYRFLAFLGQNGVNYSRTCSFRNQNILITSNYNDKIQLGLLSKDQQGATQYTLQDQYQEKYQTSSPVDIRVQDLYCEQKGNDYYVIFPIARNDNLASVYKGATVLKINQIINPDTQQVSYKFSIQEKWRYRRWRKDMEYFVYDEAQQRGQSISEYEHYSYEFLESEVGQCDFDDDGQIDSYCRMTKTISHWNWNVNMGVYFLGKNSEQFFYANDNQKGYQIRDWNSTEFLRFKQPRLLDKDIFSIRRVIQHEKSLLKLPYDTFILKMCWLYNGFSEMKDGHSTNAGFYAYKHESFVNRSIETYNLIDYMNPQENTEKYKNPFVINSAFTYGSELHVCFSYTVLEINQNQLDQIIDNNKSYQYFSNHNKECYKLKDGNVVNFYQLKLDYPIVYGQGIAQYTKCTPYFEDGQLICRNNKRMLEFWSLNNYSFVKKFDILDCNGNYDIAIHRKRFYIGCESSIIIYDTTTEKTTIFLKFDNKLPKFILIVQDVLAIVFSNFEIQAYDLRPVDGSAILVLKYLDLQDCCDIYSVDIYPVTKRLLWASQVQINKIDLTPCLEDPQNCLSCEMNAYFSYDPNFSFKKQKYERSSWPTVQPELYINAKFLDSGQGTIDNPYLLDMNIMQLYYKTHIYKTNIIGFKQLTLNLYVDINKPQQNMSNHLVDWTLDKTAVNFKPWDGTVNPTDKTGSKIKILINSYKQFELTFNNWYYLDMSNLIIICPNCKSTSLTFKNSGEIYLRNSKVSLNLEGLTQQGQSDTKVFPNIRISVQDVKKFFLENLQIQDVLTDYLDKDPFFNFIRCDEVNLKNILFSNITNKESLFVSEDSNFHLEDIQFTKINTCLETTTKRQVFSLIPFQNLVANNIIFSDNQFCDICLFQKLISSNSNLIDQLIKISKITVNNNKFNKYSNSNILFLKISLASLTSSTQSVEVNTIKFENNQGQFIEKTNFYYFELTKLQTVNMQSIDIIDENLVGIGYFNKLTKLEMQSINFINSQYLPNSNTAEKDRKKFLFQQNLILILEIESLIFKNSKIFGFEAKGVITIQIEDNLQVDLQSIILSECSFVDALFMSIQNLNSEIKTLFITDSTFKDVNLQTLESHIQIGLLWVRAEQSNTIVKLKNNNFINNYLSVNQNTQKKSSISFSIDNSISQLTIEDCTFSNQIPSSMIGDLFLNVQTLNVINTNFNQTQGDLLNVITVHFNDLDYIKKVQQQMELTTIKGTFMSVQARTINISKSTFQNALSSEGVIQMFPNNNNLDINFDECIFSNLYSSTTGTAIFISSITSPVSINMNKCSFNNLWSGSLQKYDKAHLYFESNSNKKNSITIKNLSVYNIGVFSLENPLVSSFLYQIGFKMSLSSSIIKQPKQLRVLYFDQKLKYFNDKTQEKTNMKQQNQNLEQKQLIYKQKINQQIYDYQNRLLKQDSKSLFEILKDQIFYGSSLIHSIQGDISLNNLQIEGDALINSSYVFQTDDILQANILKAEKSQVSVNNFKLSNMKINSNGGIITLLDSQLSTFTDVYIENTYENENDELMDQELSKDIGEAKAFINCLKTDCLFTNLQAICQKNNNKCKGRVLNLQEGEFKIDKSLFQDIQSNKLNGTAIFVVNPKNSFQISKSNFNALYTQSCGAGIYLFQNNPKVQPILAILENTFENNYALSYGGAVSLESLFNQNKEKLNLINNTFINNTAKISGAIYYSNYYFNPSYIQQNKFNKNNAQMANDLYSQPSGINIVFENSNSSDIQFVNQQDNSVTIKHGSGLQIPKFTVNLFYLDIEGKKVTTNVQLLQQQKEILQIDMSFDKKNPVKQQEQNKESDYYMTGNLYSQYDQDKNEIYFQNVELYGKEETSIYLLITSPYIKNVEVFDELGNVIDYEPYRFIINVVFRECSKFEILTTHSISLLSSRTKKCQICPDLSYSKDKEVCEQCPVGATCTQQEEMTIQTGYWRESYDTYTIIPCEEGFEGCIGGQTVSDDLCLEGYIGPMCQECDLFDHRGQGRFSHVSKQLCRSCNFGYVGIIVILGLLVFSVVLTMRSIKSNDQFLQGKILVRFLKTIKFKRICNIERLQNQNILIKILMTYFQLIGIIRSVDIKVPSFLPEMSFFLGSPAASSTMNANCIMPEYLGSVHFMYYSFFMSLSVPLIHFLVLAIFLKIKYKLEKQKLNLGELKAGMIFLFNLFQPEFIFQSIQIITCKDIDVKSYYQANISLTCNTNTSFTVILSLIIVFLGVIVPMILYIRLKTLQNDETFQDCSVQLKYSHYAFLCINYKHEMYYWEFIRMAERLIFILVASIFNSQQALKICILIFVAQGYNVLLKFKKPFLNNHFNKLEVLSNHVISASFILAITVYSQNLGLAMEYIFYLIFILINLMLVSYIVLLIVQEIMYRIINILMSLINKSSFAKKSLEFLIKLLDRIPIFKLTMDMKVFMNKKRKSLLYAKIRRILLQILEINPQDRNLLFLSMKETKNQNKLISNMMSQVQQQFKANKTNISQTQNSPNHSPSMSKLTYTFDKNETASLNIAEKQFSIFKIAQEKAKLEKINENPNSQNNQNNHHQSYKSIFSDEDVQSPKSEARTRNHSFFENTSERVDLASQKQTLSQDIEQIQQIKRETQHQLLRDKMNSIKK